VFDPGGPWACAGTATAIVISQAPPTIHVVPNVCQQGNAAAPPSTAYFNTSVVTIPGANDDDPASYCNPNSDVVATQVRDAANNDIPGQTVAGGTVVHDTVTVAGTPATPGPTGNVTFT